MALVQPTHFGFRTANGILARVLGFSYFLVLLGCAAAPAPAPDTRAADEAAIRKADTAWAAAAQTKKADAWMAFYGDDAVVLPPNDKIATKRDDISKMIGGLMALPDLSITWQASKVEVARSGDIAYLYGAYTLSFKGDKGKTESDHGKMTEIWRKQADGGWKCIVDTWNSDIPPAPPAK
jgi:uncharacterized protein (TIGR02246 family)